MAALYLDSSALVRRYDDTEPGASRVEAVCAPAAGNVLLVSGIASVEVASALNRKTRLGEISQEQREVMWGLFRLHQREEYRSLPLEQSTLELGERLTLRHPIRAYDAIHLASAILAGPLVRAAAGELRFCTADRRQAEAAVAEGLDVELIE